MITVSTPLQQSTLPCVAVLESNASLRATMVQILSHHGMTCWESASLSDFQARVHYENTNIVVLGVSAPALDHIGIVSELRQSSSLGIIAIPGEQSHDAGKLCLQAGADHYLLKPIDDELLVVMLQALWRRLGGYATAATPAAALSRWVLDDVNNCLIIDQQTAVGLSHQEFEFMAAVMQKPNAPINMADLHQVMFPDYEEVNSHRLSVLLNRLRKKVKAKGHRLPIRSLYGRGWVYIQN